MTMSIMIQGTGSNVGKSMLVAGLARLLTNQGYSVCPFKPQNMSNNAAVTQSGGEIGRAQALQALAARLAPVTDMNPVLLKPESNTGSQVIVHGQRLTTVKARDYAKLKPKLLDAVLESYNRISKNTDIVLIEGAGSPAEVNLRNGDIANMGFAEAAQVPVILAGDIDRGGVIAQVVGTHTVLSEKDRRLIKGYLINKFRGDTSLFDEGNQLIANLTDWTSLGVIPWFSDANLLPAEDSVDIGGSRTGSFKVVVPCLPRIANFDDIDPLKIEPNVQIEMLRAGRPFPVDTDVVLIPGSKSTISDLDFMRTQGWDEDIRSHSRRGGIVIGLCGGYQMLGRSIADPLGVEGEAKSVPGLGLLKVDTVMSERKTLSKVSGTSLDGTCDLTGYEIHIGETKGEDCEAPWILINGKPEGAISSNGRTIGSYVHGIFESDDFRSQFLERIGSKSSELSYASTVDQTLENLADHLNEFLDVEALLKIAKEGV